MLTVEQMHWLYSFYIFNKYLDVQQLQLSPELSTAVPITLHFNKVDGRRLLARKSTLLDQQIKRLDGQTNAENI